MRIQKSIQRVLAASFFLLASIPGVAATPFALKSNDTVVFYGDSITDQRLYTMWTEFYVVTRYPTLNVNFVHSGWGGDRVSGGGGGTIDTRLARDVVAYHPTVMTIMLGMNDGKYANHTAADDTAYYSGYRYIVENMQKLVPRVRITAIGPSPYDDATRPFILQPSGYNAVLVDYSNFLKKYAADARLDYADLNTGVVGMLVKANITDPVLAQKIIPDRVHPGPSGHLIMAEQLLKAWGARPVVTSVTIDAAAAKVADSQFAAVTDLRAGLPLHWTQTDEALPLPFAALSVDKTMDLAIHSSDITEALNQQPLIVTGLKAGAYKLTIDGAPLGTFSDADFTHGINLAILDTPMSKQAIKVRDLTVERIDVHQVRWRTVQVPTSGLDLLHADEAMKALDALDTELAAKQHQAAQPLPHVFEITPVEGSAAQ